MTRYKNLSGNSAIFAYEIAKDSITVEFNDGSTYLYDYQSAGQSKIETMKSLAVSGRGLNAFIQTNVKKGYRSKLR